MTNTNATLRLASTLMRAEIQIEEVVLDWLLTLIKIVETVSTF